MLKEIRCPICGKTKEPTWDHIPPKCCNNYGDVSFFTYTPEYVAKSLGYIPKNKSYQNGLKFKFVCRECNSKIGAYYDNEIKKIYEYILNVIKGDIVCTSGYIDKVALGIISHMLASSCYTNYKCDEDARNFINNPHKNMVEFANKYSLFISFYPYKDNIVVARDFSKNGIHDSDFPNEMMSILYFYPLAFILTNKQKSNKMTDLLEVVMKRESKIIGRVDQWTNHKGQLLSPFYPLDLKDGFVVMTIPHMQNAVIASKNRTDPYIHLND